MTTSGRTQRTRESLSGVRIAGGVSGRLEVVFEAAATSLEG